MKRTLLLVGLIILMLSSACAQSSKIELNWLTNLEEAQDLAAKNNVPILINFTGSDWCQWCFKLRDEVFLTEKFEAYSKENLVLVEVDFPREKKLTEEVVAYNRSLAEKYEVKGYPTLMIVDAAGKVLSQMGYIPGGPEAFIGELEASIKTDPALFEKTVVGEDGLTYYLHLEKAKEVAKASGKSILINFTGSDWCSWCHKIRDEILSKDEFKTYADENLVLVLADFPKEKKQTPSEVAHARSLGGNYGVEGLPTLLIVDVDGKQKGKLGYMEGGPEPFIDEIKRIIK